MAGGVKKPVNVFRLKNTGEPKEVFNWRLWFAVLTFGLMGAARGVDEGLISGAFNSPAFQESINYESYSEHEQTNIKANVSAMVQIGSVGGALLAFVICDRIGRLWATRVLCTLWILGIAIFMGHGGNLGAVYAGRFVAGLGVGQTVVVGRKSSPAQPILISILINLQPFILQRSLQLLFEAFVLVSSRVSSTWALF